MSGNSAFDIFNQLLQDTNDYKCNYLQYYAKYKRLIDAFYLRSF